jgi:DNA-binding response OmpR family regulator
MNIMVQNKEILIIDDSWTSLILLEWSLNENGYKTKTSLDVKEALKYLEKQSPDLILLDLMLPQISGYDFLKIIKHDEKKKNIPVLVISAASEPESIKLVKELGAVDFISKPFGLEDLNKRINSIINAI